MPLENIYKQSTPNTKSTKALQAYQKGIALFEGIIMTTNTNVWSAGESRLQEMLSLSSGRAGAFRRKQHHDQSGRFNLKILSHDPYRESAHRQLIRLAIRRGERATAVARYHQLKPTHSWTNSMSAAPKQEPFSKSPTAQISSHNQNNHE